MDGRTSKIAISIVLVLAGASLAVLVTPDISFSRPADGIIIDFGERDIAYVPIETSDYPDAASALGFACLDKGYDLVRDGSSVGSIDSRPAASDGRVWNLFVTYKGDLTWTKAEDPSDVKISEYSAVAWGLCSDGEFPTVAVDATGVNYYGYPQATRVVTLSPSATETVVAVGGYNTIVGTDMYSDYPHSVAEGRGSGRIAEVGGYSTPSFELVVKERPDLVVCISTQATHVAMSHKLREKGINTLVSFDGESIDTILDNVHMIGTAMGYDLGRDRVISTMYDAFDSIKGTLETDFTRTYPKVMVTLSTAKSPWVSGGGTYMSDILDFVLATNVYGDFNNWIQANSESVFTYNPDIILVVGYEGLPTQEEYERMLEELPAEWKRTSAFKTGEIYVFEESSASLASRPAPRAVQLTELVARILHPDSFGDGIKVPKYFGNEFKDYLSLTKDMEFS
ncbi:MAG: helical backbone metal receptor [Candidatus Methanoplasma sp.]|jgi:iron complex transport system substrate-binding protein|nr:helical backbone metal receptor [Candidatus Methanoplasma sp.]